MEHILGIDFGTSNSCLVVWHNSKPIIINDIDGSEFIPSVIEFDSSKKTVGYNAYMRKTVFNNEIATFTVYEIKKLLGKKYSELSQEHISSLAFKLVPDKQDNILIHNLQNNVFYTPEEIAIHMFMSFKAFAETAMKTEIKKCVISVPAYFNKNQREIIKFCATSANFEVLRMINEPTAAAVAYGIHNSNNNTKKILVYDLGGGTLDISVVELQDNLFQVIGSNGNPQLGGSDFDQIIMNYCINEFKTENKIENIDLNSNILQKLKYVAEQAKKTLSTHSSTIIFIKKFYNNIDLKLHLTREIFYNIANDLIDLLISPIPELLEMCELDKEEIHEIILVGGMTHLPIVKYNLEKYFNKTVVSTIDPNNVVAIGAAIIGWTIQNKQNVEDSIVLIDKTSLSVGIETSGGIMNTLIPRGTIIPCTKIQKYTTDTDDMESIDIKIFEGERKFTKDNFLIGDFTLTGIEPENRGLPEIEITFKIDVNGIIKISALDLKNPVNKNSFQIHSNHNNLSNDQINEIITKALEMDKVDREIKFKKESNTLIKNMCSTILENLVTHNLEDNKKDDIKIDIENIVNKINVEFESIEIEEYKELVQNIKNNYAILLLDIKSTTNELETQEEKIVCDTVYDDNNSQIEYYKNMYNSLTSIKNNANSDLILRIDSLLEAVNDILIKLFTDCKIEELATLEEEYNLIIKLYKEQESNDPIYIIMKQLEELETKLSNSESHESAEALLETILDYTEYIYKIQRNYIEYEPNNLKITEIQEFIEKYIN